MKSPLDFVLDSKLQDQELKDGGKWICISIYDLDDIKKRILNLEDTNSILKHQLIELEEENYSLNLKIDELDKLSIGD